jgi:hypothetical protein
MHWAHYLIANGYTMVYRIPHFWTEKYDKSCSLLSWQPGKIWQMQRATNVPSRRENAGVLAKEAHLRLGAEMAGL